MTPWFEAFRRNPVRRSHPVVPDQQPEASVAWCSGRVKQQRLVPNAAIYNPRIGHHGPLTLAPSFAATHRHAVASEIPAAVVLGKRNPKSIRKPVVTETNSEMADAKSVLHSAKR